VTDAHLSDLDRRVLTEIQAAFPISSRPYAELADRLAVAELDVFDCGSPASSAASARSSTARASDSARRSAP
jgi:hypothetical protein